MIFNNVRSQGHQQRAWMWQSQGPRNSLFQQPWYSWYLPQVTALATQICLTSWWHSNWYHHGHKLLLTLRVSLWPFMATGAAGYQNRRHCVRTMDPDLTLSSSRGLDVTMAPGDHVDHPDWHGSMAAWPLDRHSPRWRPRLLASACPSMATGTTDISIGPLTVSEPWTKTWPLEISRPTRTHGTNTPFIPACSSPPSPLQICFSPQPTKKL